MNYLKNKGHVAVNPASIIDFFDNGNPIAKNSILLSFDDGYADFYKNVWPILRENGFSATVFLPTGLVNNLGYLNWSEITEMSAGGIIFANHTWSHKNAKTSLETLRYEITTADRQLIQSGLNNPKIFAYPFGIESKSAFEILSETGYRLAFSTKPGSVLCSQLRLDLPRIRVGNSSLSKYGL